MAVRKLTDNEWHRILWQMQSMAGAVADVRNDDGSLIPWENVGVNIGQLRADLAAANEFSEEQTRKINEVMVRAAAAEKRAEKAEAERDEARAGYERVNHKRSMETDEHGKTLQELAALRSRVADLEANPRDEYHTMAELYEYRMLYNAHTANALAKDGRAVKSWKHSDGELCFGGGWFVVVMDLLSGQVTNHYEAADWELFSVPEVELAPKWDGHTPKDAADRLRAALADVSASAEGAD